MPLERHVGDSQKISNLILEEACPNVAIPVITSLSGAIKAYFIEYYLRESIGLDKKKIWA